MEPWEKLGISLNQYNDLAKRGILNAYTRNIEDEQAVQADQDALVRQQELNRLREAQGDYELEQQRLAEAGISPEQNEQVLAEQYPNPNTDALKAERLDQMQTGDEFVGQFAKPINEMTDKELAALYKGGGLGIDYPSIPGFDMSGYARGKNALMREAALQQLEGEAQANLAQQSEQLLDETVKKQQLRNIAQQKQTERALGELEQAKQELSEMGIDKDRFWADKTTGDKLLAGISVFLGGFGAGFSGGGQNRALETIKAAINQDIALQKNDIEKKRADIGEQKNMYRMMLDKFGNEQAADAATLTLALEGAKNKMKTLAATMKGPKALAAAEKGIAALEIEQAKAANAFNLAMQDKLAKQAEAEAKKSDLYVKGWGDVRNERLYKDFAEKAAKYDQGQSLVDSLVKDIEAYTFSDSLAVKSKLQADIEQKTLLLQAAYRDVVVGGGTLTEFDFGRLKEAIPSGASAMPWLRKNAINKLRAIQSEATRDMEALANIAVKGYTPARERRKNWNRLDN